LSDPAPPPVATPTRPAPLPFYPTPLRFVEVEGYRIAYHEALPPAKAPPLHLERPPLVLVHGLGTNLSVWRLNIDELARGRRVVAFDLPGFGCSGKDDVPGTMAFFARIAAGVLDALDLDEADVAGVSMGGQVSATLALTRPERVRRLVLVSPAGIEAFTAAEAASIRRLMTADALVRLDDRTVQRTIARNLARNTDAARWLMRQRQAFTERAATYRAYAEANARAVGGMLEAPVADRLGALAMPTLMLFGASDRLIPNPFVHGHLAPEDVARTAARAAPDARVELLADAGHLLMLDRPAAFHRRVRRFLSA
jgi:pimeloyl-ACP methyl ester carboxylesterase